MTGLALLAGCGASRPTQAQYAAKANAICQSASAQTALLVTQVASAAGSLSSGGQVAARQLASALQRLHGVVADVLAKLRALERPSSGGTVIERFLTSLGTLTATLDRAATAVAGGQSRQALVQLEQAAPLSQQMAAAAKSYGMTRCESLPALIGTTSAQAIHATLVGESHHPIVDKPWHYTVTVTDAQGNKLSGVETTHYTYNGVVVGTEQPQNVSFTNGVYRDTIEFPAAAVGHPLELEVVLRVSLGTATLRWPIEVVG